MKKHLAQAPEHSAPHMRQLCRGCQAELPKAFLDLGVTPLANFYVAEGPEKPEPRYPLAVCYCPACHLIQLMNTVPPEELFSNYTYFSSYSDAYLRHAHDLAEHLVALYHLGPHSRVLEIASNDGYLLKYFQQYGIPALGVEPAQNIAEYANSCGIRTLNRFFALDAIEEIKAEFGQADVVIGNNVVAHVPATNEFFQAVRACLAPGGHAVFEFPYVMDLLQKTEFDTIYHEHVFYLSLSAFDRLVRRANLQVVDVQHLPLQGGTLRVYVSDASSPEMSSRSVQEMLERESEVGLISAEYYDDFGQQVDQVRDKFVALVRRLKSEGKRIAAYGAPAKGNTLLNYCGVGRDLIDFTVDRSPHKQGKCLPGSHIPVLTPEELTRRMPDYAVILAWNLADEIIQQQQKYLERGGKFIIPIPQPYIVSAFEEASAPPD
jgi:SAM-dependent methyltransferase